MRNDKGSIARFGTWFQMDKSKRKTATPAAFVSLDISSVKSFLHRHSCNFYWKKEQAISRPSCPIQLIRQSVWGSCVADIAALWDQDAKDGNTPSAASNDGRA